MKRQDFRSVFERWLLWVLVTGITWPASVFLTVLLIEYSPFEASTGSEIALDILLGSLLIAAAQLLILRPDVKGIGSWLGFSLIGWCAGNALISCGRPGVQPALGLDCRRCFWWGCFWMDPRAGVGG